LSSPGCVAKPEKWSTHFGGNRVHQDLRITSGLPGIHPKSAANSIEITVPRKRGCGILLAFT
jgi:hypothetical protein